MNETDKPRLSSQIDSGELEQNAVKVMFLWKTDPADVSQVGCSVAKNRRGRTGEVNFYFEGAKMNFMELSYRNEDDSGGNGYARKRRNGASRSFGTDND